MSRLASRLRQRENTVHRAVTKPIALTVSYARFPHNTQPKQRQQQQYFRPTLKANVSVPSRSRRGKLLFFAIALLFWISETRSITRLETSVPRE